MSKRRDDTKVYAAEIAAYKHMSVTQVREQMKRSDEWHGMEVFHSGRDSFIGRTEFEQWREKHENFNQR